MKKHQPKVDLGLVYGMYGGISYPGLCIDAELSKEFFRSMKSPFRRLWKAIKSFHSSLGEKLAVLQNLL